MSFANPLLKNDEIGIQQTVNHLDANARFYVHPSKYSKIRCATHSVNLSIRWLVYYLITNLTFIEELPMFKGQLISECPLMS